MVGFTPVRVMHRCGETSESYGCFVVVSVVRVRVPVCARPLIINEFEADHPYLYFIRENTTKSVLFVGKMENPME